MRDRAEVEGAVAVQVGRDVDGGQGAVLGHQGAVAVSDHDAHGALVDRDQAFAHQAGAGHAAEAQHVHGHDAGGAGLDSPVRRHHLVQAAVQVERTVVLEGRVQDRQCSRGVDRVHRGHVGSRAVAEPLGASGLHVDGVDQQGRPQLLPASNGKRPLDVRPQHVAAEDAHGLDAANPRGPAVHADDVGPAQAASGPVHLARVHARGDAGGHHGPDGAADRARERRAGLLQPTPHAHVRQALDAAAAQHQPRPRPQWPQGRLGRARRQASVRHGFSGGVGATGQRRRRALTPPPIQGSFKG